VEIEGDGENKEIEMRKGEDEKKENINKEMG
jgi:hypothetical protein